MQIIKQMEAFGPSLPNLDRVEAFEPSSFARLNDFLSLTSRNQDIAFCSGVPQEINA
jgi:hypothetical protein